MGERVYLHSYPPLKMNLKFKKLLQTISILIFLAYLSLLTYQSFYANRGSHQNFLKEKQTFKKYTAEHNVAQETTFIEHYKNVPFPSAMSTEAGIPESTKLPTTFLDDVFISVKTTQNYHYSRLPIILKTWFGLAKKQIWFFTDNDDPIFQKDTDGHMINTNCSSSHSRKALCCKMSVEFDTFLNANKKWFCHFDDDNYVNVPRLVRFLGEYDPREDWYLGKPSIQTPLEITNRDNQMQKVKFWFATGGAGFCLSRALALKMVPVAGNGKFISIGEKIRLPDDVTMGYIIEYLLRKPLTVVDQFHSHLEPMKFIRKDMLKDQISFSYSKIQNEWNVIRVDGFDEKTDQNRFLSLHCFLFPHFDFCRIQKKNR